MSAVLKETLSGEAYTRRVKEIEAAGGWIFRMDVGRSNGEWIISWYPKEDEALTPKIAQQQEMKLHPSE